MEIIELNIDDLKVYENNPRNNDEAVKYVKKSIKEFGMKVPLVVDKNNVINLWRKTHMLACGMKATFYLINTWKNDI